MICLIELKAIQQAPIPTVISSKKIEFCISFQKGEEREKCPVEYVFNRLSA